MNGHPQVNNAHCPLHDDATNLDTGLYTWHANQGCGSGNILTLEEKLCGSAAQALIHVGELLGVSFSSMRTLGHLPGVQKNKLATCGHKGPITGALNRLTGEWSGLTSAIPRPRRV